MVDNEGKACDAIVRLLESRTGETRADVRRPERDLVGPPVDLRLTLGAQEYAIEHTRIEPFEKEIHSGVAFEKISQSIKATLSGTLPKPGHYEVVLPIPGMVPKRGQVLMGLCESIHEKAQHLHERSEGIPRKRHHPAKFTGSIRWVPPGLSYKIELRRWPNASTIGRDAGSLEIMRSVGADLEDRRTTRIETAIQKKSPKLRGCKTEGARTVLVMESNDIALTNHQVVAAALTRIGYQAKNELESVDEIYLVETEATTWSVWPLKYETTYRPVEAGSVWKPIWDRINVDADDLIDLTRTRNPADNLG